MKPKAKFYSSASYALSKHTPVEELYNLAKEFEGVTTEDVDTFIKNRQASKQISTAIMASKDQKEIIYNELDVKCLEKHPNLILFRRGENSFFYEYRNGVYIALSDTDMYDIVDNVMAELQLFDYRTSSHKVKDTVRRISSLLSRTAGKCFSDERVYNQKWKLNLVNGLLDIQTKKLEAHTPDYFSTVQVPYSYEPNAQAPLFEAFIKTVSDGHESTAKMIQEMFGYCISDGNPRHKVFYLYGNTARNGKSTTAKLLCGLIGWGNVSTLSLSQIAGENASVLTSLIGKQINFSDEISNKYITSSRLTTMSAEGLIEINPKFKSSFLHKIRSKFVITCNDLPNFHDSQGMKHRMISIPFTYQIPTQDRIVRYEEELLAKEGSGILNWALKGVDILNEQKDFSYNTKSLEDMHENNLQNNPVYAFLEEYEASKEIVTTEELYGHFDIREQSGYGYLDFCHSKGLKPLNFFNFSKEVRRYADEKKNLEQVRIDNKRAYKGFKQF